MTQEAPLDTPLENIFSAAAPAGGSGGDLWVQPTTETEQPGAPGPDRDTAAAAPADDPFVTQPHSSRSARIPAIALAVDRRGPLARLTSHLRGLLAGLSRATAPKLTPRGRRRLVATGALALALVGLVATLAQLRGPHRATPHPGSERQTALRSTTPPVAPKRLDPIVPKQRVRPHRQQRAGDHNLRPKTPGPHRQVARRPRPARPATPAAPAPVAPRAMPTPAPAIRVPVAPAPLAPGPVGAPPAAEPPPVAVLPEVP